MFQSSPGSIDPKYDYAKIFCFAPYSQLQSDHFAKNWSISIERGCLDYLSTPKTVHDNLTNVKQYTQNSDDVQYVFLSNFTDMLSPNATTSIVHLNTMFDIFYDGGRVLPGGTMWYTIDGFVCCMNALAMVDGGSFSF